MQKLYSGWLNCFIERKEPSLNLLFSNPIMKKIIFLILLCVFPFVIHDFITEQKRQIVIHNSSPYWLQINVSRTYENQTEDEAMKNYWGFNLEKNESSPIYFSYNKKNINETLYLGFSFSLPDNDDVFYTDESVPTPKQKFMEIHRDSSDFCERHIYIGSSGEIIKDEVIKGFCLGRLLS